MMSGSYEKRQDGTYSLCLDTNIYSNEAILKTVHLFLHKCHVNFSEYGEANARVEFSSDDKGMEIEGVIKDFLSELVDQQLRFVVRRDTQDIHKLIISEAFAPLEGCE